MADFLVSRYVLYLFLCSFATGLIKNKPSKEFLKYSSVHPLVYHARTKRAISYTNHTAGTHHPELILKFFINHKQYVLDLSLNEELVTDNYVFSYQNNGETVLNKPKWEEVDLCQYHGSIRGRPGSRVALSTCRGVHGVLYDDDETLYIEPAHGDSIDSPHFVYNHLDLTSNNETMSLRKIIRENNYDNTRKRLKRSNHYAKFQEPFNANSHSLYIEMALVVDNSEYKKNGGDLRVIRAKMQDLANIINSIFVPLNIFVALVGVKVWNERDEIPLSADADQMLKSFLKYRRDKLLQVIPHDNANLLTHQIFENGVVGKAFVGSMCDVRRSGTVMSQHSEELAMMAASVAHEIGHTLGMDHDYEECTCSETACIMSPQTAHTSHWSQCSLRSLALFLSRGGDYCLKNKPTHFMGPSRCGNGFVEPGEECDCGNESNSQAECLRCCQANCQLRTNATCAGGECCDLITCQLKPVATLCRNGSQECSLPEYCTGLSQFCPSDVHVMDTTPCGNNTAYCFRGRCRSHDSQCRYLWGPAAVNGHRLCYTNNAFPDDKAYNYNRNTNNFIERSKKDSVCGLLQCEQYNDHLEFIVHSEVATKTMSWNDKIVRCYSVKTETDVNDVNPANVPNGAKCGSNKMCYNHRCIDVASVRQQVYKIESVSPSDCSGYGVLNSNGNCHCDAGFAPPFCDQPGAGGSIDSGPASDVKALEDFKIAMYIIFLGILPSILLILSFIMCVKKNKKHWWEKRINWKYFSVLKIEKSETKPKKYTNDEDITPKLKKEDIKIISIHKNEIKPPTDTRKNRDLIETSNHPHRVSSSNHKSSCNTVRTKTPSFTEDCKSIKTIKDSLILNSKKVVSKDMGPIIRNEITVNILDNNAHSKSIYTTVREDYKKKSNVDEKSVTDKNSQCNVSVKHLRKIFDQPNNIA